MIELLLGWVFIFLSLFRENLSLPAPPLVGTGRLER
jgi:hypothetical protein